MLTLYDYLPSQNAYKVRLLLSHLNVPYKTELISIFEGKGQNDQYRKINPSGAVPAIKLEDGRTLAESNAILMYLAEGTDYFPEDSFSRSKIAQWLFFESDYIQAGIATLRYFILTNKDKTQTPELLKAKRNLSLKTLKILDRELAYNDFLGGPHYTIADISVFAYTHLAREADLNLDDFSHIVAWINRIKKQDGHVSKIFPYSIDVHSSGDL